jgi:enterochelin esterase-like enzyme
VRLHSLRLADGRRLTVYLPDTARVHPRRPYPLLILHDGQNLFERDRAFAPGEHWRVGETADRLIADRVIPPIVVCGVDHGGTARIAEMTPTREADGTGGLARRYVRLVADEALPLVRAEFPVRQDRAGTAIGGSSLGGLVTLFMLVERPGLAGSAIVMSPSVWWDRRVILRLLARRADALSGLRLWLDVDLSEGAKTVEDTRRLAALLSPRLELSYVEAPGPGHSEASWAARLPNALTFLFGARRRRGRTRSQRAGSSLRA